VMPAFERRLRAMADHPLVGDVRVCGLMGAVELVADKSTRRMFDPVGSVAAAVFGAAQRHGLIVRTSPSGDTLAFCPPLVVTEAEIDEMFDRFERALAEVEADVAALR
jgi:4-aminobutyrate---pyruvate transaminase